MPEKLSVDEIVARRKDIASDKAPIMKAAKSPASWNKDSRSARFIMNSQAPDRYGDVVVTAGIDTTLFESNPVGLLFHSSRSWPIGNWSNLEKVLKGRPPRIEGDLTLLPKGGPIPEIDQAAWMIENGGIRACSIGFRPDWEEAEMILDEEGHWTGGIKWNASELLECSVVSVPASPQALIKDAAGDWRLARELIEEMLDTYAKTPEGILVPREEFEKAYRLTVEKIAEDEVPEGAKDEKDAAPEAIDEDVSESVVEKTADEVAEPLSIEKAADEIDEVDEKTEMKLGIELDTSEAVEKVNALSALIDTVAAKLAKFFGSKAVESEPDLPPAPPSAEAVEAAKSKAAAIRERLAAKGLIET